MWVIILGIAVFIWYSTYQQIILGIPFGDNPAPDPVLIIIWLVVGIGFPIALFSMKLTMKMDSQEFSYRLFPLHLNTHSFNLDDIEKMESVFVRPILDFGGWGIRWGRKGKGYIISGRKAVKVSLKAGRPIYFSSDEPDDVVEAYRDLSQEVPS